MRVTKALATVIWEAVRAGILECLLVRVSVVDGAPCQVI